MSINTVDVNLFETRAKLAETQIDALTKRLFALETALGFNDVVNILINKRAKNQITTMSMHLIHQAIRKN